MVVEWYVVWFGFSFVFGCVLFSVKTILREEAKRKEKTFGPQSFGFKFSGHLGKVLCTSYNSLNPQMKNEYNKKYKKLLFILKMKKSSVTVKTLKPVLKTKFIYINL